jgi:undecaprenyl phosphate N,N'-diacetylbacillosamine 1-phosphate transferase
MYRIFFKRMLAITIASLGLPIFFVFYLLVGIAIKLEDAGPVLYCGERVGKNLKIYKMYKFRSMKPNSTDLRNEDGSTFNSCDDTRLTRVGKVIRKLSIDEIPQILNVLKGDMNLIGPRPSPCGNTHLYNENYLRKFTIRPGITGYVQAYFRNNASVAKKQESDLYYIDHISFVLDLKIFVKTIHAVIKREGVYSNEKAMEKAMEKE